MESLISHSNWLGIMPFDFMRMTFSEFKQFYDDRIKRIEFEKDISDRHVARICCVVANVNRTKKSKPTPYTEDDFMPQKKKKEPMSVDQMAQTLKVICLAYGGVVNGD